MYTHLCACVHTRFLTPSELNGHRNGILAECTVDLGTQSMIKNKLKKSYGRNQCFPWSSIFWRGYSQKRMISLGAGRPGDSKGRIPFGGRSRRPGTAQKIFPISWQPDEFTHYPRAAQNFFPISLQSYMLTHHPGTPHNFSPIYRGSQTCLLY